MKDLKELKELNKAMEVIAPEDGDEFEYEWITPLPKPEPNRYNNSKPDDEYDVYEHLDCDGTAW